MLGNGADELIRLCAVATLDPGDARGLPVALVPELRHRGARAAAPSRSPVPLAGRAARPRRAAGARRGGPRTKLVYLANPNNPTGALLTRGRGARASSTQLPDDMLCVLDEAYAEYADPEPEGPALRARGRAAAVRAAHVLQGLRAGRAARGLRARLARGGRRARPRAADLQREPAGPGGGARVARRGGRRGAARGARAPLARAAARRARRRPGSTRSRSQANFVYADVPGRRRRRPGRGACCTRRAFSCASCPASARPAASA